MKINIEQYRKSRNGKPSEFFFLCTVITDAHQYTQSIYRVNEQWHFTIKIQHEQEMPVWCLLSLFPSFSYSHSSSSSYSSSSCFFILQILISDSSKHIFFMFASNKISEGELVWGRQIHTPYSRYTHMDYILWIIYVRQIKWRTKANEKEKGEWGK